MSSEFRLTKTLVLLEDGLYKCDTLVRESEIWLVPEWIDNTPTPGFSKPVRAIRLYTVQHAPPNSGAEFLMPGKLPKIVFYGKTTKAEGIAYEILILPDFYVELHISKPSQ